MTRLLILRIGAVVSWVSLSVAIAAAAQLPSTTPKAGDAPMQTGTDGYGMQFWFRRGHDCRLVMIFDGPVVVSHLSYLKTNNMVSKSLTPAMAQQEPDFLSLVLAQRVIAVALPGLARTPGADSCDVVTQVVHTPLSTQGMHTLLSFRIGNAEARTFYDHVPPLSEIRAKTTLFILSGDDLARLALESDHATAAQAAGVN